MPSGNPDLNHFLNHFFRRKKTVQRVKRFEEGDRSPNKGQKMSNLKKFFSRGGECVAVKTRKIWLFKKVDGSKTTSSKKFCVVKSVPEKKRARASGLPDFSQ
jgi:hypothetical protein